MARHGFRARLWNSGARRYNHAVSARCLMKNRLLAALVATVGVLAVSGPALAHHGNAAYDDKITEFKQAKVTQFAWANPHALINFDAMDAKGKLVHMVVSTTAPQALRLI